MRRFISRITPLPIIVLGVVGTGVYLMFMPLADAVPVIFGGFIAAIISYAFWWLSSEELRTEAEKLLAETQEVRRYVDSLMSHLEMADLIEVHRDEEGKPPRIVFGRLKVAPTTHMRADADVIKAEDQGNEEETAEGS
jgi:hypothetical protein